MLENLGTKADERGSEGLLTSGGHQFKFTTKIEEEQNW